ncbi:MAG: hypothetical protein ACPG7U_05270, partial [Holosporaceae bacterium]
NVLYASSNLSENSIQKTLSSTQANPHKKFLEGLRANLEKEKAFFAVEATKQKAGGTKQAIETYIGYVSELLSQYEGFSKEINHATDAQEVDNIVRRHKVQVKTHQTVVKSLQDATHIKGTQSVQKIFSPETAVPSVVSSVSAKTSSQSKTSHLEQLEVLKKSLNDTKSDYDALMIDYDKLVKEYNKRWRSLDPKKVEAAKKALIDVQLKAQKVKKKTVILVAQIEMLRKKVMARLFPTYNFATLSTERPRALNVLNPSVLSSEERQEIQSAKDFLKHVNEDVQLRKDTLKRLTREMHTVHQSADNAPKTAQDPTLQQSNKTPKKWSAKKKVAVAAAAVAVTTGVTAAVLASQR